MQNLNTASVLSTKLVLSTKPVSKARTNSYFVLQNWRQKIRFIDETRFF